MLDRSRQWPAVAADLPGGEGGFAPVSRAREEAARHSRKVRRLKIWLPVAGVLVLLVFGGWTAWNSITARFGLSNVLFTKDGVTMVEPHVTGRSQGHAYELTAQKGLQAFDDPKKVRFETVVIRIEMQDRRWIKVVSPTGIFDGTKQTMRLEGGIDVVTSDGYHITGKTADIELDKGTMVSSEPVRIVSADKTLDAGSTRIENNGAGIHFNDRVSVTIVPQSEPDDAARKPAGDN